MLMYLSSFCCPVLWKSTITLYFENETVVDLAPDHTGYGVLIPQLVVAAILLPRDYRVSRRARVVLDVENEAVQLAADDEKLSLAHGVLFNTSKTGSTCRFV